MAFEVGYGQNPPAGFSATTIASGWVQPVGVCFATDGRMVVWEKAGKVWMLEKDASGTYVKPASPLLDLSEEVGDWRDHGLLGLALDPQFTTNGRMYLLYVVDRYYLNYHDINNQPLAGYNPAATNLDKWGSSYQSTFGVPFGGSIGRLTRYSARSSDGFHSIDLASRQVLLGETISTGIPVLYETHGIGALAFGSDGSLLLSCGDGASTAVDTGSYPNSYAVQALKDGVITAKENVGSFRSQLVNTHSGKILRLDPQTGDGLASNPYFDASQPRAPRSRVFALGFRNPFRFTLKPGTGSSDLSIGDPGVLYLGDVGLNTWEEMDVVTGKGQNFGWPIYEGLQWNSAFSSLSTANPDAPNPLYNGGSCNQPNFAFVDLLKEDSQNAASFPNPCDATQQVPDSVPHWVHTRPVMDWKHGTVLVRTAGFDGLGNAQSDTLGTASSPMTGGSFAGSATMAGVWYTADNFPAQYKNTYFHGDYVSNWLRNFSFNTSNQPVHVGQFINTGAVSVSMAVNNRPDDGALYYVNYSTQEVRRVAYTGNKPAVAVASANKTYGASPLAVQFSSSGSMDPEGGSVSYLWNFGDGGSSALANPTHSFTGSGPTKFTVTLTVKDSLNAASSTTVIISVNNTPPVVHITSPVNNSLYSVSRSTDSTYQLTAAVSDAEQSGNGLTYQWQTVLHHNTHVHAEPVDNNISTTADISPIGCDGQLYYFSISLTVTDAAGLSSSDTVNLYPDCDQYLNIMNLLASAGSGQVNLAWTPPVGVYDEVLIVASTSSISGQPSGDGSSYIADSNFNGLGTALLGGKVIYKGTGSSQMVTGLSAGLTYFFQAFTRVGSFWSHGTQVSATPTGNAPPTVQASNLGFPIIATQDITINWLVGNGTGRVVKMNISNVFTDPTYGVQPVANSTYAGTGEQVVYLGTGSSVAVNGLVPNTVYYVRVYEYNGAGSTISYLSTIAPGNPASVSTLGGGTSKATPVITWTPPADFPYGTALSSTQLNATANVAGTFTYAPPAATILSTGNNQTLSVTFSPTDATNYSSTTANVLVNVLKATPVITWNNPLDITTGTALSSTQLNATANVAGTFTYAPPAATILSTGNNQTLSVTFSPTDATNYSSTSKTVAINVVPASCTASGTILRELWTNVAGNTIASIPLNTTPTLSDQLTSLRTAANYGDNYGQRIRGYICAPTTGSYQFFMQGDDKAELYLSSDANAANKQRIATVSNSWSWTQTAAQQSALISLQQGQRYYVEVLHKEASGTDVLRIGWRTPDMASGADPVFIPGSVLSPFVPLATPVITWTPPADFPYGTALSSTQLNATANVAGTFTYAPPAATILSTGNNQTLSVTFSPTDATNYSSTTANVLVNVLKATPVITWNNPLDITTGTALSSTQLNATANVAGTFTYAPPAATILSTGNNQTLSVTFSPTDATNYSSTSKTVAINVVPASCTASGTILRELWTNVAGNTIASIPLNTTPTLSDQLTSLRTAANYGDNYGQRIRGYICAPTTGSYQFFMQGDDKAELYLSSDANAANKQRIATVSNSWSWTQTAAQQSALISLQQGQRYYVEVLHKEASGTDVLRIGWRTPDMASGADPVFIPGSVLSPFVPLAAPVITWTTPADFPYGTALSSTQLNATANVAGTFTYAPPAATILSTGNNQTLSVTFSPTDATNYSSTTANVLVNVLKATPVITWNNPLDITTGTALSSTQLNATANVAGTFTYAPPAATILSTGNNQTLSVTFSPTDATNYSSTSKTAAINVVPASCTASGTILRELWTNVAGNTIASIPLNTTPTLSDQLTSLRTAANYGDNYGQRIRGYICAPTTGSYQFFMQGDDKAELYLSSDANAANKQRIATVSNSWSWTQTAAQQSALISLQQGQRYYVEVLHKEASGTDVLRIGWRTPDMASGADPVFIPGSVLSPFVLAAGRVEVASVNENEIENELLTAYPNPFSEEVSLEFTMATSSKVVLDVYDLRGELINHLYEGETKAGEKNLIKLNGNGLAEGIYIIRLITPSHVHHQKIVLSRK